MKKKLNLEFILIIKRKDAMDIKEVLNGNIFKVWAKFIIASVVGVVLNTIYTMVDGIFIGQGIRVTI